MTQTGRRVLIEGHNLTFAAGTGIATYCRQLAESLRGLNYETSLLVGSNRGIDRKDPLLAQISFFDAEFPDNLGRRMAAEWRKLTVTPFAARPVKMPHLDAVVRSAAGRLDGFAALYVLPHLMMREMQTFRRYGRKVELEIEQQPDLFHATRPAPLHVKGCPNIYTIHDIVPLRLPFTTLDDKKLYLNNIRDLCKTADHIVTVSEFSRRDIIDLTGMPEHRITNTYQAVNLPDHLVNRAASEVARDIETLFGLTWGEYFVFVGAMEPKKNISRLIDAYSVSGTKKPLIIAGSDGWMNKAEKLRIADERFVYYQIDGNVIKPARRVRQVNFLPFDHLIALVRGARALLFPSIYEGFGLPVLEAMQLGTPVLTSNVSSLPEIAGDAALCVDPYNIEAIARGIRQLDADDGLCADLSAKGKIRSSEFSPEIYSQRLSKLYSTLLG